MWQEDTKESVCPIRALMRAIEVAEHGYDTEEAVDVHCIGGACAMWRFHFESERDQNEGNGACGLAGPETFDTECFKLKQENLHGAN